jgi:hypothetical protein
VTAPIAIPPTDVAVTLDRPALLHPYGHVTGMAYDNGGPRLTIRLHDGAQLVLAREGDDWILDRTTARTSSPSPRCSAPTTGSPRLPARRSPNCGARPARSSTNSSPRSSTPPPPTSRGCSTTS